VNSKLLQYALVGLLFGAPNASSDTLVRSGCAKNYPGVQWSIYEDTEGNRYVTKDPRSRKCGFSRKLNLSLVKEAGDRFDPVVISVDYKDMLGREEPWGMVHHSTTRGTAKRVGCCTVEVYGDGSTGDGVFTLGVEEIQFRLEPEPVCPTESNLDCQGYEQRGSYPFIYYGEDDDRLVTWELGVLVYASHAKYGIDTPIELMYEYPEMWDQWEDRVQQYNEVYERSGVHVRYELKEVWLAHYHTLEDVERQANQLPVDVVLAYGTSYRDTCGVAYPNSRFNEGQPPASMSQCDVYTDLHEIGHSVGLAHGPENQSNQKSGYIFPEFGHGWNDVCGHYDDLMSYGVHGVFHSNSLLVCNEVVNTPETASAGHRQITDTAYAINRVRYNVSLVNDESFDRRGVLRPVATQARRLREMIVD